MIVQVYFPQRASGLRVHGGAGDLDGVFVRVVVGEFDFMVGVVSLEGHCISAVESFGQN
jgi:hypothetical protein